MVEPRHYFLLYVGFDIHSSAEQKLVKRVVTQLIYTHVYCSTLKSSHQEFTLFALLLDGISFDTFCRLRAVK